MPCCSGFQPTSMHLPGQWEPCLQNAVITAATGVAVEEVVAAAFAANAARVAMELLLAHIVVEELALEARVLAKTLATIATTVAYWLLVLALVAAQAADSVPIHHMPQGSLQARPRLAR